MSHVQGKMGKTTLRLSGNEAMSKAAGHEKPKQMLAVKAFRKP